MTELRFGFPKQDLYRKKDIQDKYSVSVGTINNRIMDGTFTKIVPKGSRLVYFKCKEVDAYFKGETKTKTFSRAIVTSEMKLKVKQLPQEERKSVEQLLKDIEKIEKKLGLDSLSKEIGITKKKKAVRKKRKRISSTSKSFSEKSITYAKEYGNRSNNNNLTRGGGKGGLSKSIDKCRGKSSKANCESKLRAGKSSKNYRIKL